MTGTNEKLQLFTGEGIYRYVLKTAQIWEKRTKAVENVKQMLSIIVGRLPLPTSRLRLGVERLLVA